MIGRLRQMAPTIDSFVYSPLGPDPSQPSLFAFFFPFTFFFSFALSLLPFLFLYDYDFFSLVGGFVLCGKDGWIMCHVSVLDW